MIDKVVRGVCVCTVWMSFPGRRDGFDKEIATALEVMLARMVEFALSGGRDMSATRYIFRPVDYEFW